MADVSISKFTQLIRLQGQASVPSLPPSTEDTPPAVNPPGSGGLTGVNQFIQLTDTPATYSGGGAKAVAVKSDETGLEFVDFPTVTGGDEPTVKTTASADQNLPSGVLTILDFDTTLTNNATLIYSVATDGRITVSDNGVFDITAGVVIEANAVTALESAFLGIFRNGDLIAISSNDTTVAAGNSTGLSCSTQISLLSGDIIDCRVLVNSVGGVANGIARRLGLLLGSDATQVNSLTIVKCISNGQSFTQLSDTPATYSGATLNYARVNAGETGLEFRTPAQVLTDIGGVPTTRTITINGNTQDLSLNRTWTIPTHDPVTLASPANGLTLSGQELGIGLASSGVTGALSGTDWNKFDGKLNLTSQITGYTVGANTALTATDTILQAFEKVQGQINSKIGGSLSNGFIPKANASNNLENSLFSELGTTLRSNHGSISKSTNNSRQIITGGQSVSVTSGAYLVIEGIDFGSVGNGGNCFFDFPLSKGLGIRTIPTNTLDVNGTTRIRTINNLGSTPTEVLVPSATGVVSKRTLSEFAGDIGAVTITGTQTITGEKTFSNSLLIQEASAPILRLKTTNDTQATVNFRNISNEDEAGLQFDAGLGKFSLLTRVNNCDIEIAPHGTGSILLPNVPSGSGTALGINASDELVTISSFSSYKLLDEDITPSAFTSTTYSTLLTGGILGTNSFNGATDASYEGTIFIRSTSSGSYNFDLRLSIWSQNIDTAITIGAITGDIIHKITFKLIVQSGNFLITGLTQFTDSAFTYGYEINPSMTTYTASGTSSLDIQAKVSGTGSPTLYLTSFVLKQIE